MQTPSLVFSLRCTRPTTLSEPIEAHPSITGVIRELVEQMVGQSRGQESFISLNPVAWQTCQIVRPELAARIHRIGVESLQKRLSIGPVWQQLVSKPLDRVLDADLHSPDEPLPLDLSPEVLAAAERSKDAVVDVLMSLNRLREDASVQDRLRLEQGCYHPDMDALWSNICLALVQEGVTSPFGEAILEAIEGLPLPLAHSSDGLHPLIRLVEVGVSESLLRQLVEIQPEPLPPLEPQSQRFFLTMLVRKQMWTLLRALRDKGWDGRWNTIAQDLPATIWRSPRVGQMLDRLLGLGLELESLLATSRDDKTGSEFHSAVLRILLEGSESLWGAAALPSGIGGFEEDAAPQWDHVWSRLPAGMQNQLLSEWLRPKSRIVTFLSYHHRLAPLHWLLSAGLKNQIRLDQVRWPNRTSMLNAGVASLLLHHGGLRDDPRGIEVALRLNAMVGDPMEEALTLLHEMKQRNFCRDHVEAWERLVQEGTASFAGLEASIRSRLRAAHQVLEEAWAIRHARLNGAVVFAFAISQILCRARIGVTLPPDLRDLQRRPAECLPEEGQELFRRAWRESIQSGRRPWVEAQNQALCYWVAHSPLDSSQTTELVRLWLDVLCVREGKTPPRLHLPAGDLIADDLDWAIEQTRRTLMGQVLA